MNYKNFLNNKAITIAIVVISSISIFLVWFLSEGTQKQIEMTIEEQFGDSKLQLATEISNALEEEINCTIDHLNLISQLPEVKYGGTKECSNKLREMNGLMYDKLGNISRLNKDGVFDCGLVDDIVGVDANEYPYIQKILSDPEHNPVMSRAIMFQYTDHEKYLVAIHIPVYDDNNNFKGTLGAAIYFDEIYDSYIKEIVKDGKDLIYLIDDNGDILYHPNPDFVGRNQNDQYMQTVLLKSPEWQDLVRDSQSGVPGTKKYVINDEQILSSYAPASVFPNRHWSVITSTPTTKIKGFLYPIISNLKLQVILVIFVLLLFTVGIVVYCRREILVLKKKHNFITMISHQLRTPVTAIKWELEIIGGNIEKVNKEYIANMYKKINNLNLIVDNLLFFLEKENKFKKIKKDKFDLVELIQKNISLLEDDIQSKNMIVNFNQDKKECLILANKKMIDRVTRYFIDNAVTYSKKDGGIIDITIFKRDKNIKVSVQDDGIGIPESEQSGVFKKFFRATNASLGKNEGSGISLYLAKSLIKAHKGAIGFESSENKGSIFWFEIPYDLK